MTPCHGVPMGVPHLFLLVPTRFGAWATRAASTSTRAWRGQCWRQCCGDWSLGSLTVLKLLLPPVLVWVPAAPPSPSTSVSLPMSPMGGAGRGHWVSPPCSAEDGSLAPCGVSLFPMSLAAPLVERGAGPAGGSSLAEHLAEVARQPAFIAGVGGACWVVLAAFAAWLYSRRRRKKELSHFTGTGGCYPWDPSPLTSHPSATHRPSLYSLLCLHAHG